MRQPDPHRLARIALLLHAGLIGASIFAFRFIVDRPAPEWIDPELWSRAYAIGMRVTGPAYITSGFLVALAGSVSLVGLGRGLAGAAAVIGVSLGFELAGTSSGFPFGPYGYGDHLGPKILGLVPVVIPLSWFLMLYASLAGAVRPRRGRVATAGIAALGLLAWDVLMDPTMSAVFPFWSWHRGGVYYGMPLVNWFGWLLTGFTIALVLLRIGGDRMGRIAGARLPLVLYALNGLFPLALALQAGLVGAALAGAVAMSAYLAAGSLPDARRRLTLVARRP